MRLYGTVLSIAFFAAACTFDPVGAFKGSNPDSGIAADDAQNTDVVELPEAGEPADGGDVAIELDADMTDADLEDNGVVEDEAGVPDLGEPDVGVPDVGIPDAGAPFTGYTPSNFAPTSYPGPHMDWILTTGTTCFINTTFATAFGCSPPVGGYQNVAMPAGGVAALMTVHHFEVANGAELFVDGEYPLIIAAYGDAVIDGAVYADADLNDGGAGSVNCMTGRGTDGRVSSGRGAGGGGGSFGTAGGDGGDGNNGTAAGGAHGSVNGDEFLLPLRGGCYGGLGGTTAGGDNGGGGGAVQLSASGSLTLRGRINAVGGGGLGGTQNRRGDRGGGGGGGSGGAVLLEASYLSVTQTATISVAGGAGGEGSDSNSTGQAGENGARTNVEPAEGGSTQNNNGGNGGDGAAINDPATAGSPAGDGGGGGGGGLGRIRLHSNIDCEPHEDASLTEEVLFIDCP